ncbi:hypothetical protein FVE85_1833 [Porphyridium purpureum]|uniref:Uncharacterized protein n=1 Tax=Porphyridium purpureum TaxID=35688 RepID=A0A5J4YWZ9_PORPP|nr:hypothetical protein FVE85_1833 [Porphyridium purpureum]|eukprot:POR2890..scf209_3
MLLARWSSTARSKRRRVRQPGTLEADLFGPVDLILYAQAQAYPCAVPYKRMHAALVESGFLPSVQQAKLFTRVTCKTYKNGTIAAAADQEWLDRNGTVKGQNGSFVVDISENGYRLFDARTRHFVPPDKVEHVVHSSILSLSDLPRSKIILPPVLKAMGKQLAGKYRHFFAEDLPEEYMSVLSMEFRARKWPAKVSMDSKRCSGVQVRKRSSQRQKQYGSTMSILLAGAARRSVVNVAAWRRSVAARWSSAASGTEGAVAAKTDAQPFTAVDFVLYALVQAYPRAIPYRTMQSTLVEGGFFPTSQDARFFLSRTYRRFRNISIPTARDTQWIERQGVIQGRAGSFVVEFSDKGYMQYEERTRHLSIPDSVKQLVNGKILSNPDLPRARTILPPVREVMGEELVTKYQFSLADEIPEEFLSVLPMDYRAVAEAAGSGVSDVAARQSE